MTQAFAILVDKSAEGVVAMEINSGHDFHVIVLSGCGSSLVFLTTSN